MFQAFYNGLSGLMSFSKGLNQISNNVANMNTPGFKAKDVFYQSIGNDNGTGIGGEFLRNKQGDIRQTGNSTDLAIDGHGYFVLKDDNHQYYTRAGQFTFNQDNLLVDRTTGYAVCGIDAQGKLTKINVSSHRYLPPQATTEVILKGNISADGESHNITSINAFNRLGEDLNYSVEFSDRHSIYKTETDAQGKEVQIPTGQIGWTVTVKDSDGEVVTTGEVRYDGEGKIVEDYRSIQVPVPSPGDAEPQNILFTFSGTTGYAAGEYSDMSAEVKDGHALAGLSKVEFSDDGKLKLTYSNGEEKTRDQLALANVNDPQQLIQESGALFSAGDSEGITINRPKNGEMGKITGSSLELANVDLAEEFADMLIVQRGYQSSSQVMNVANELIETLYNSGR